MRAFDRWLGVPLCAIATWLARRDPRKPDGAPRQPLFIGLSETGSLVLASPALQAARAACGHSPWFLILAHNRSALELTGAIDPDRVFTLRADSLWHLLCDSIGFARRARRHGIDAAFDLEPFSRVSALLAWLSGAALRTGFAYPHRYRGQLFTHPLPATEIRHISLAFLDLVRIAWPAIPAPAPQRLPPPALPAIPASARWRDWLQQRNPAFEPASMRALFINANAGDLLPQRRWPEARYARLARALLDRHADLAIFLTGAPGETAAVAALARQIDHPRCCSIAGAISLADLPALFGLDTAGRGHDALADARNVAAAHPDIVRRLEAAYATWATRVGALPWDEAQHHSVYDADTKYGIRR